jgi:hypothetical protein
MSASKPASIRFVSVVIAVFSTAPQETKPNPHPGADGAGWETVGLLAGAPGGLRTLMSG